MLDKAAKLALYTFFTLNIVGISASNAIGQVYSVELNKTELVRLDQAASAVVIGNPVIADVSVHSDRTLFVIGRSFGETNILVLDAAGDVIVDADIHVTNAIPANGVRVYRGANAERSTYSCSPYCIPSPVLGDTPDFVASNTGEAITINNQIATQTPTSSISSGTGSGFAGATTNTFDDF